MDGWMELHSPKQALHHLDIAFLFRASDKQLIIRKASGTPGGGKTGRMDIDKGSFTLALVGAPHISLGL